MTITIETVDASISCSVSQNSRATLAVIGTLHWYALWMRALYSTLLTDNILFVCRHNRVKVFPDSIVYLLMETSYLTKWLIPSNYDYIPNYCWLFFILKISMGQFLFLPTLLSLLKNIYEYVTKHMRHLCQGVWDWFWCVCVCLQLLFSEISCEIQIHSFHE